MVQTRGSGRGSHGADQLPSGRGAKKTDTHKTAEQKKVKSAASPVKPSKRARAEESPDLGSPPPVKKLPDVLARDLSPAGEQGPPEGKPVIPASPEKAIVLPRPSGETCRAPFEPTRGLYVGAHVSGAGGLWNAVREAHGIGARSFALFLASQRSWTRKPLSAPDAARFRHTMDSYGYSGDMVVPHGSYLMNLGSPDPETRNKSRALLVDELERCEMLGLPLFNFHPGSTCGKISREKSIAYIAEGVSAALKVTEGVTVLLENMSRQGNTLGGDFAELRAIIDAVEDNSRVGVCLDTCHAHAAGYDLSTEAGFRTMMTDFERQIGMERLRAVHLNDCKSPVGSHTDRHANIGKGTIGRAGIARVLADPRFQRLPIVLETPYVDDDIYRREIKLLYEIATA